MRDRDTQSTREAKARRKAAATVPASAATTSTASEAAILSLQHAIGNRAVSRLLATGDRVVRRNGDAIADAAEKLEDEFVWTLPGGSLEWNKIALEWPKYRAEAKAAWYSWGDEIDRLLAQPGADPDGKLEQRLTVFDGQMSSLLMGKQAPNGAAIKKIFADAMALADSDYEADTMVEFGDDFSAWLADPQREPSHMNCWEAVLFTCVEAGVLTRTALRDHTYGGDYANKAVTSEGLFREFILKRSMETVLDLNFEDKEEPIPEHQDPATASRGNVLCFWKGTDIDHVAISLSETEAMSIWADDTVSFRKTSVAGLLGKYDEPHVEVIEV